VGSAPSFLARLSAERDLFAQFLQTLQAEQACLLRADVEGLLDLAQAKSAQVDSLAEMAVERAAYLQQHGVKTNSDSVAKWLEETGTPEAAQVWRELIRYASEARRMNETNGTLITTRLSHNQAALAALHSVSHANDLYGRDGQAALTPGRREIGRA
jgi:flagella synthesis protein FlgN